MANHYFYVLLCADNTLYGGYTNDLDKRLAAHNAGQGAKYTKARRPVEMIYTEAFADKSTAMKREYWFKETLKTRPKKLKFLKENGIIVKKEGGIIKMDNQTKVLEAFKAVAGPARPGEIAETTEIDKKEVSKIIKVLKENGEIFSPKRCFYQYKA
ncbi:GIY-YIG nuclease family protein [Pseudolactococcus insecticola]|uniref:GIY-YIG domain-containing protein n=1 Tax=Pseudolactococcus insecticola TaxID=2709158 RepID=A0A6A0B7B5_9LACT|nr:GIY-YIG nuclease family protein [Lactococcus insecticola]GFH41329.1 hypothetical protein Hs20B_17270 [Lactococcus insecticola]